MGHRRVERRTASVCHEVGWLQQHRDWPGFAAIGKVIAQRHDPRHAAADVGGTQKRLPCL